MRDVWQQCGGQQGIVAQQATGPSPWPGENTAVQTLHWS